MAAFNQTIIIGNLGKDPESRYLTNGDPVCNFSVAVTEKWKSKDGDQKEQTTWFRINAFGKLAEICGQYLKKGASVMVIGKMQSRKWSNKDGVERESWELRADSVQMLGLKPQDAQENTEKSNSAKKQSFDDMDDDIPF